METPRMRRTQRRGGRSHGWNGAEEGTSEPVMPVRGAGRVSGPVPCDGERRGGHSWGLWGERRVGLGCVASGAPHGHTE